MTRGKVVVVLGTNASGKSRLGVEIAKAIDGAVISADSRQVYRGLNLGAGKLTAAEMEGVVHHLIDVADVSDDHFFSLADYQRLAYSAIDDTLAEGRQPIVVGGTGLYIRAIVEGYELVSVPPDYSLRELLEEQPGEVLYSMLSSIEPALAARQDPRNRRRLIRLIEVSRSGASPRNGDENAPRYVTLQLGLTWPMDVLRTRIEERLRLRLDQGMVEEVKHLMEQGVGVNRLDALGLEYRYLARFVTGEYGAEELFARLSSAIQRFARRQISWFRKQPGILWLDTQGDYVGRAIDLARAFVGGKADP